MSNQQILEKAIEHAVENGFGKDAKYGWKLHFQGKVPNMFIDVDELPGSQIVIEFDSGYDRDAEQPIDIKTLIYDHDFAKAFWGEENGSPCTRSDHQCEGWHQSERPKNEGYYPRWIYHLELQVISDDPVKYLEKGLTNPSPKKETTE